MDYKILVNKQNYLDKNKIGNLKLVTTKNIDNEDIQVEKKTYEAYLKLKEHLEKKNIIINILESYRTKEEQIEICNEFTQTYGLEYCQKYAAPPGHSEHETGLAIDIGVMINGSYFSGSNDELLTNKEYLKLYEQIHTELHYYGFILRYPKGKESITGYSYEPWHIRYVGTKTATIIYNEKLTLEEYSKHYNLNGVIVVNKDKGMTSRDVADIVGKILDTSKVGHTGTLDPLATGVLVLTLGKYTKLSEELTSLDKEYIAEVKVGVQTDTLDITGNIIQETTDFSLDDLEKVINSFKKTYYQEVPKYSAIKVHGKKLYEYARNNIDISLPQKQVTIKEIKLLSKTKNTFTFSCIVSKGTYIRSLIRDIGKTLNIPMTMTNLKRTRQGIFEIEKSSTIDDIKNGNYHLLTIDDIFNYPRVEVDENTKKKILNGIKLENKYQIIDKVIFTCHHKNLAIYQNDNNTLKMWKIL